MDQRRRFVLEWRSGTMSRAALCQLFGISRQTGYKWVARFERAKKWSDLEDRSRRPQKSPNATPKRLVKLILSQKKQRPLWGPAKIRLRLKQLWPRLPWPAVSTVGAILKRHGKVTPRRHRYRVASRARPFTKAREPNDVWSVDFKGQFRLGDGRLCYPLTVMDAASRYLLACIGFHSPSFENVRRVFDKLFMEHGLPKVMLSDNGEPFASTVAAAGLTQLSVWWVKLGIKPERIDLGRPDQNARHERMHRTLKEETCASPRRSLGWQQRAFDKFRPIYNGERPHEALDGATPSERYVPSTRPMPTQLQVMSYPFSEQHRVRPDGCIRWLKRNVFISSSLAGEIVGLNVIDGRYFQILFAQMVLGILDTEQPERGLIRPKQNGRREKSTRVSAMSPV